VRSTSGSRRGLVWFRRDLRLDDNPAWAAATATCAEVIALFVVDPVLLGAAGPFRRRQVLAEVAALDDELRVRGGRLHVRVGDPTAVVPSVVAERGVDTVAWNADVTPYATRRDDAVTRAVTDATGSAPEVWFGTLVHPPGAVLTNAGTLSRVFTPFSRTWRRTPLDAWPEPGDAVVGDEPGDPVPTPGADPPLAPGADGAWRRLRAFLEVVDAYDEGRDRPDRAGTSLLSADLKFGTLSPRTVLDVVGEGSAGREAYTRQLAWRDWYAHLLAELPWLPRRAMKARYDAIVWRDDAAEIAAWEEGRTGIPLVDAGMRQLRETGWMHNRVRMVCGSFLVKNLLVDWRIGERHFRRLLVDADVPQNVGNWQWVAGTGPDASPYNRIFNPVTQSRRFDPTGAYLRRHLPELGGLDADAVHAPWEVPPLELAEAGVTLGETYPEPIVDLVASRVRALAAYAAANERATDGG
jgi:deoxyribodipyrimidine photo-lyase